MTPDAKAAWVAWMIQKAECHRTGKPFPGASRQITEEEADALLRARREEGKNAR